MGHLQRVFLSLRALVVVRAGFRAEGSREARRSCWRELLDSWAGGGGGAGLMMRTDLSNSLPEPAVDGRVENTCVGVYLLCAVTRRVDVLVATACCAPQESFSSRPDARRRIARFVGKQMNSSRTLSTSCEAVAATK